MAALSLAGCRDEAGAPVRIVLGPAPSDTATLVPRASLAELIELSPTETVLLLTLTSAERTCDALPPPQPEAASVSLRLRVPGAVKLEPGTFPLLQEPQSMERPYAAATVKLHGRRQELRAGGDLQITRVDASPEGSIDGLLKLEFAGDAEHPATAVSGRFFARFCRINRLR